MSIKLNFSAENNLLENDILFFSSILTENKKEGIALDAFRVLFQSILESSDRLETKLLDISQNKIDLSDTNSKGRVLYSSILADAWILIDNIRRLELIISYIPDCNKQLKKELNKIFEEIRYLRNSFQHIDNRINEHFNSFGGSVFGDLFWRYRESKGQREILNCLITGVSKVSRDMKINPNVEVPEFVNSTGIYDVQLFYIEKKQNKYSKKFLNIDKLVHILNQLISFLEFKSTKFIINSDKTVESEPGLYTNKIILSCDPPRLIMFRKK